jgi:hypothetical protein
VTRAGDAQAAARDGDGATAAREAGADGHDRDLVLGPLPPDAPFEGTIRMQVNLAEDRSGATYAFTVRGKKVRWNLFFESGAAEGYRVYDGDEHRFYTVVPAQSVVMTTQESDLAPDAGKGLSWKFTPMPLEPKGGVHGYSCDRQQTRDEKNQYDICVASGLVPFPLQLLPGSIAQIVPFNDALVAKGLFPLSVTVRPAVHMAPAQLAIRGTLVALDIDRGRVPDGAFAIPPFPRRAAPSLQYSSRAAR